MQIHAILDVNAALLVPALAPPQNVRLRSASVLPIPIAPRLLRSAKLTQLLLPHASNAWPMRIVPRPEGEPPAIQPIMSANAVQLLPARSVPISAMRLQPLLPA